MADLVKAVLGELDAKGRDYLDKKHKYGLAHPLIGKPCLFRDDIDNELRYALPYGAHVLDESASEPVSADMVGIPLLAIAYYDPDSPYEGRDVHVKELAAVKPDQLIPVDPTSRLAQQISHTILSWLVDNRDNTCQARVRRREQQVGRREIQTVPSPLYG